MKTIIYVDGFNLFYGCLKNSQDKWLDLHKLFLGHILKAQCPSAELVSIKFFTAEIKAKVATRGQVAQQAQQAYHRALQQCYPELIEIIYGYYALEKARLPLYQKPPDKLATVDVWKLEEKQTDVQIALTAYRDAIKGYAEQLVIVSNDTDLAPVLRTIRQDLGQSVQIGVVMPIRKPKDGNMHRPPSASLSQYANWTRSYITEQELAHSHLPGKIPTRKRPIIKPDYW